MFCCSQNDKIEDVDYDKVINKLTKISIQIEPIWRGLYFCPICKTYWEEQFIDDRFGGRPFLNKVTAKYVEDEWGPDYLLGK